MSETPDSAEQPGTTTTLSTGFFPIDDVARETNCVVIDWMDPIDPMGAVPICLILLGGSWLFAFSGWEDYVDAVHTPWLRVVLPCVLLLLAASFIPRDFIPGWMNRRTARRAIAQARAATRPQDISVADAATLLAYSLSLAQLSRSAPAGSTPKVPLIYFDLAQYGLAVPRIILDRRIAGEVLAIERLEDLLEPESIDTPGSVWRAWSSVIWLPPAIAIFWLLGTNEIAIAVVLVLGFIAIGMQAVQWARTGVMPGASGFVAGVGYLEWPGGARLAAGSVMTVVSKPWLRSMRVRLLAPNWNCELMFRSPPTPASSPSGSGGTIRIPGRS